MTGQSSNKRDLILESAEKVFLEKGFYPAKIEEIATNAGVAKGTIYIYFKDKESIYFALIEKKLKEANSLIKNVVKEERQPTEKLKEIYYKFCHYVDDHRWFHSLMSLEHIHSLKNVLKRLKKRALPKVRELIENVAIIINEGIKKEEFEDIEPLLGAILFLSYLRVSILFPIFEELYSIKFRMDRSSIDEKILDFFFYGFSKRDKKGDLKDKECS